MGTEADVDQAVASARRTFRMGTWVGRPASERGRCLLRFADMIEARLPDLARIEADEAGKTISSAKAELAWSLELLRFAASLAWQMPGRMVDREGDDKLGLVSFDPLPVVGMILPWNFPTVTLLQKLPYALVAGCSVVIKPSEFTSGTTLEYAAIAQEAGIPDGVISVVTGTGSVVGEAMCRHPGIDMISFTGSTTVGRRIAALAGETLKKVTLELGGKGANIVFADADFEAALAGALAAFTINQGEECCAGGRLLVQESIAPEFVARLSQKAAVMRMGTPDDPDAEIGPMIHEAHLDRVLGHVVGAVSEGAQLRVGGRRASAPPLADGFFVEPTVLTGVTPEMSIFSEEVFGPVLAVTTFRDVAEAVALANETRYGLANGVWTSNLNTAFAVSRALDSGVVYVNTYLETVPHLPFGGRRQSGLGSENGVEGLLEFMTSKSTFVKLSPLQR
jgi:betaine-aldehyde dehydrogenase